MPRRLPTIARPVLLLALAFAALALAPALAGAAIPGQAPPQPQRQAAPSSAAAAGAAATIELIYEQLAPSGGAPVIPAIQNDVVYLAAEVRDAEGELVDGVPVTVTSQQDNGLIGPAPVTRDGGYTDLTLLARSVGADRLTVTAGEATAQIGLDVRPAAAVDASLDGAANLDGVLGWARLMQVRLDYDEHYQVSARYPPDLAARFGDTVRLVGYMLPIEMSTTQHRFILSANPPVCFFHLPGGPATVVDVQSERPIPMSWDPVVVEGRLQAERQSDSGLLYRLTDARLVEP